MSEDIQYCPYCGTHVEKGALFCGSCGASFASTQQSSSNKMSQIDQTPIPQTLYTTQTAVPSTVYVQQKQTDTTIPLLSLIFGILGCVTLGFVGGLVAVILGHMSNKKGKTTNASVGLVLGYISIVVWGLGSIAYLIFYFGMLFWWW